MAKPVNKSSRKTSIKSFQIKPNHPIVFAMNNSLDPYYGIFPEDQLELDGSFDEVHSLENEDNPYSIYDA
jgi:hypothetical protein